MLHQPRPALTTSSRSNGFSWHCSRLSTCLSCLRQTGYRRRIDGGEQPDSICTALTRGAGDDACPEDCSTKAVRARQDLSDLRCGQVLHNGNRRRLPAFLTPPRNVQCRRRRDGAMVGSRNALLNWPAALTARTTSTAPRLVRLSQRSARQANNVRGYCRRGHLARLGSAKRKEIRNANDGVGDSSSSGSSG